MWIRGSLGEKPDSSHYLFGALYKLKKHVDGHPSEIPKENRSIMEKRTLFTLYFSLIAAMLGLSIISPILPTIATDLKVTGVWMGIFNTIIFLVVIVAPLISGAVMDYAGINSVFHFAGILSLVFTFIGCYYVGKWSKAHKQR